MKGSYENRWPLFELARAAARGESIDWPHGGDQLAEYIHVEDVARGVLLAYSCPVMEHGLYHVSFGRKISTLELADVLRRLAPDSDIRVGPGRAPKGHAPEGHDRGPLSYSRAKHEFGYQPIVTLEDGMEGVYAWLLAREQRGGDGSSR